MVEFLAGLLIVGILEKLYVVLTGSDAQRKVLAFLVGLQAVLLTVIQIGVNDDGVGDGIALWVPGRPFDGSGILRQDGRNTQSQHKKEKNDSEVFFHIASRQLKTESRTEWDRALPPPEKRAAATRSCRTRRKPRPHGCSMTKLNPRAHQVQGQGAQSLLFAWR